MVGKDKELDKVVLQVMKAIDGKGSVVNVIVEVGIGKSRLIAELNIFSAIILSCNSYHLICCKYK